MPDFASSKTQRAAGKHLCRASRPAYTPARLAAWTAPKNYVLPFSQPCRQYSHIKRSAATSKLLSGSSRPTHPAACLSVPAPQSPVSPQPPLRQHIPVLILVLSTPPPFHATKKRKPTSPVSISFSYNSNPSISFAISFTALLAVQSVYSSAQATQWSYINATRSPVSLILALISAIFSSSSFFNSF